MEEYLGISPIPQLIRRYIASGKDTSIFKGISEEKLLENLREYIGDVGEKNIDRIYDSLSPDELETIFRVKEKNIQFTLQDVGKETLPSFKENPEDAMRAIETLENGVRTQEQEKEGQTQGE